MQVYLPVAEISLDVWPVVFLGLSVGVASGMFGVGGGFIITPVLLFLHIPPQIAVAAGVSQVAGTSVSGALSSWYNRRVDLELTRLLIYGSLAGLIVGSMMLFLLYVSGYLSIFINASYVIFLSVMSILMLWEEAGSVTKRILNGSEQRKVGSDDSTSTATYLEKSQVSVNTLLVLVIGAITGSMSVLLGVGGSIILMPMLIYLCQIPLHIAIGTTFIMTLFTSSISLVIHANITHSVDIVLTFLLCLGSIVGLRLGLYLFDRIKIKYTRLLFLALIILITIRMFVNLWQPPSFVYWFQAFI